MFSSKLIQTIREAQSITVLTGAGISKESGVPTFREAQTGLWAQYQPQSLATPQAFERNPELVWNWYAWRRELVSNAKPNAGHQALVELAAYVPVFTVITQNVDNLHQEAGSTDVIELHGNIAQFKCFDCARAADDPGESEPPPPRCEYCGGFLRPDVVWFGETLDWPRVERAVAATTSCDLFMSIGTSTLVTPAAALPFEAMRAGVYTIEINPDRTPFSDYANEVLVGPAGTILPDLLRTLADTPPLSSA